MTFDEYQEYALKTVIYSPDFAVMYPVAGLAGEAGEVANKYAKVLRDDGGSLCPASRKAIAKEIGGVLWMASALAEDLGFSLDHIAQMNLDQLESRKARGTLGGSGDDR